MSPVRTAILKAQRRSEELDIPTDPRMVFYARLWEKNAPVFVSSDLYARLMTRYGAVWTPQGHYFDGVDDKLTIGDTTSFKALHGALDTTGFKWTIHIIMAMTNPKPDTRKSFFGASYYVGAGHPIGVGFVYDDRSASGLDRCIWIVVGNGTLTEVYAFYHDKAWPNNTSYHLLTVTYNQSLASANCKVYIDSQFISSGNKAAYTPSTGNSAYAYALGTSGNAGEGYTACKISEAIIEYGKVELQAEISNSFIIARRRLPWL